MGALFIEILLWRLVHKKKSFKQSIVTSSCNKTPDGERFAINAFNHYICKYVIVERHLKACQVPANIDQLHGNAMHRSRTFNYTNLNFIDLSS